MTDDCPFSADLYDARLASYWQNYAVNNNIELSEMRFTSANKRERARQFLHLKTIRIAVDFYSQHCYSMQTPLCQFPSLRTLIS